MKTLPDHILRLVPASERKAMGKAGLTAEECLQRAQIKNERDLKKQVVSYLEMKGIVVFHSRTDKKTRRKVGEPDLLFAVWVTIGTDDAVACAWELKFGDNTESDEQIDIASRITTDPNRWRYAVIRSLDDAIAELKAIGFAV